MKTSDLAKYHRELDGEEMNKHLIENGGVKAINDDNSMLAMPIDVVLEPSPSDIVALLKVQTGLLETILLRLDKMIDASTLSESARLKTEDAPPETHE